MKILLISASVLFLLFIIRLLFFRKTSCLLNTITVSAIGFGIVTLGLYQLIQNSFGASTPILVKTENHTKENLKIYSIIFWNSENQQKNSYVYYDRKLKPKEKSENLWFESAGITEVWVVAKNEENTVEYLTVLSGNENEYIYQITDNQIIDSEKSELAKQLTQEKDKIVRMERFGFWANVVGIGLLVLSLLFPKIFKNHGPTRNHQKIYA